MIVDPIADSVDSLADFFHDVTYLSAAQSVRLAAQVLALLDDDEDSE